MLLYSINYSFARQSIHQIPYAKSTEVLEIVNVYYTQHLPYASLTTAALSI